jgi:plasmid stabilization system protein ParE
MVKRIRWNKNAIVKVEKTAEYLELEFSIVAAERFVTNVYECIEKIKKHPSRGRKTSLNPGILFINLDNHRQLFYRIQKDELIIIDIFDTRQNPEKRPFD